MDKLSKVLAERHVRCVNIDWLEVYVLESNDHYPCNADYFRQHGYFVKERDYGTRVYKEMFIIEDEQGHDWLEVRRNPATGSSAFKGCNRIVLIYDWSMRRAMSKTAFRDYGTSC